MSEVSSEKLRELYNEHGGDTAKLAAALGLSAEELAGAVAPAPVPSYRRKVPPADLGHDYFRAFIVSRRHADYSQWPAEDEAAIEEARAKYEAGTHTICQQRDRNWFVLFCVPLKTRVGARKFFRTDFE